MKANIPNGSALVTALGLVLAAPMAYGMDYKALGVQTGEIVVRILKGEKPGAIASETSNKLSLQVNPAAAQKQGITLAEDLVKSAAKVVQ